MQALIFDEVTNTSGFAHFFIFYLQHNHVASVLRRLPNDCNEVSHSVDVDDALEVRDGLAGDHDGAVPDIAHGLPHSPADLRDSAVVQIFNTIVNGYCDTAPNCHNDANCDFQCRISRGSGSTKLQLTGVVSCIVQEEE